MTLTESCTLGVLTTVCEKYKRGYCYPSHRTIVEILRKTYDVHIGKRQLCNVLRKLETEGFIRRQRRRLTLLPHGWRQQTTLYTPLARAWRWVKRVAYAFYGHIRGFRVKWTSQRDLPKGSDIRTDHPLVIGKDQKDPPFWSTKVGIESFEKFKTYCQSL